MDARVNRGEQLLAEGRRFAVTPGFGARLFAPLFAKVLDQIDARLERGGINGFLPDGAQRRLGFHAPGHECEVHLKDWRALMRLATGGSVGWYQAWEAGEWTSPDPVPLFALFMDNAASLGDTARAKGPWRKLAAKLHGLKENSRAQAERNIHAHYDLGNDFYACWLDATMTYSSGLGAGEDGLEAAQRRKWARLAERIGAAKSVLEIGCGWGSLAGHLAASGADVTAISISDGQLDWARAAYPQADFRKQDYRDVAGHYDAIVSVEMVEALGREYWPDFMDCIARNLTAGGRAAIQYIAIRPELFPAYEASADFIQAYIFPGGLLIDAPAFRALAEERGLAWEDQEDFGLDYADTLLEWRRRFDAAAGEGRLPAGFDAHFCDLWRYYLMYCEGGFRGGGIEVSQVTLVKQ